MAPDQCKEKYKYRCNVDVNANNNNEPPSLCCYRIAALLKLQQYQEPAITSCSEKQIVLQCGEKLLQAYLYDASDILGNILLQILDSLLNDNIGKFVGNMCVRVNIINEVLQFTCFVVFLKVFLCRIYPIPISMNGLNSE